MNWQSIWGRFEIDGNALRFLGEDVEQPSGPSPGVGLFMADSWFTGGTIEAEVSFSSVEETACELVMFYDPDTKFMVTAGIGASSLFNIRHWSQNGWVTHAYAGDRRNLTAARNYALRVTLRGSSVSLSVDGVVAASATLPFAPPQSQVGVWCWGRKDITVSSYKVQATMPQAFIVMPFSGAYDDLDRQVIRKVCETLKLDPVRADDVTGPGIVVADIALKIREAQVVIAEITEPNCNVYYEIGYAHALNKPTILLAQQGVKPPFDVSPFRILYYQDTIGGKSKLESSLEKHVNAVLREHEA